MSDRPTRQREKRSRMSGEERREDILAHAKHIFATNSYAEASTGELARASGVTEPMLYKHFGSKKGLFLEVLSAFGAQFMTIWSSRIDKRAEQDLLDALSQVIMEYRATLKADPDIVLIDLDDRSLDDLILQRGDAERALATIWLRNHPSS